MIYNRIPVAFGNMRQITGPCINYQYDVKQILVIKGLDLPDYYEVDFCNDGDTQTITMVGTADGVQIPDDFLLTGKKVKAYIVVQGTSEGAVQTRYEVTLPVRSRPARSDIQPTPAEQQQIDELVGALNDGVARSETAAENAEQSAEESDSHAEDSEAWAVGQRKGTDVDPADETYQNNAKYWAGEADERGKAKATLAESWAVGGTGTRPGEDEDNAKFYAEKAEQGAAEHGWIHFYIDEDGHLIYVRTPLVDLDFKLENGHLFVGV